MSDYISKSALIKRVEHSLMALHDGISLKPTYCIEEDKLLQIIDKLPTLDEKEIILKAFERVVERLEEARKKYQMLLKNQGIKEDVTMDIAFKGMINIVKEGCGING